MNCTERRSPSGSRSASPIRSMIDWSSSHGHSPREKRRSLPTTSRKSLALPCGQILQRGDLGGILLPALGWPALSSLSVLRWRLLRFRVRGSSALRTAVKPFLDGLHDHATAGCLQLMAVRSPGRSTTSRATPARVGPWRSRRGGRPWPGRACAPSVGAGRCTRPRTAAQMNRS